MSIACLRYHILWKVPLSTTREVPLYNRRSGSQNLLLVASLTILPQCETSWPIWGEDSRLPESCLANSADIVFAMRPSICYPICSSVTNKSKLLLASRLGHHLPKVYSRRRNRGAPHLQTVFYYTPAVRVIPVIIFDFDVLVCCPVLGYQSAVIAREEANEYHSCKAEDHKHHSCCSIWEDFMPYWWLYVLASVVLLFFVLVLQVIPLDPYINCSYSQHPGTHRCGGEHKHEEPTIVSLQHKKQILINTARKTIYLGAW